MLRPLLLLFLSLLFQSCVTLVAAADKTQPPLRNRQTTHSTPEVQGVTTTTRDGKAVESNGAPSLIQPLIDPAKLATLGERGANPRIQKITAILWQAKQDGHDPVEVAERSWSESAGAAPKKV